MPKSTRIIMLASNKGGVGKTTLTAALSLAAASIGKRAVAVDLDLTGRSLELYFGCADSVLYDFSDLLYGRAEPEAVCVAVNPPPGASGSVYLCAAPFEPLPAPAPDAFSKIIGRITAALSPDIIFLDTQTRAPRELLCAAGVADTALVLTDTHPASVLAARRCADALDGYVPEMKLLINKFDPQAALDGECAGICSIIDSAATALCGVILQSETIARLSAAGRMTDRSLLGDEAFNTLKNTASRLCASDIKVPLFSGLDLPNRKKLLET